jgi:hypothetical protein
LHRLGEHREVGGVLQIEEQGPAGRRGELARERRFAALARPEQRDDRVPRQGGADGGGGFSTRESRFHVPCIFEVLPRKCKEVVPLVYG